MIPLYKSFCCAVSGIIRAIKTERNFRIHLTCCVYVLFFSFFYEFSRAEYAVLILTLALVLAAELINTAIEQTVDISVTKYDITAKRAKDISAGGVLICALGAVGVGIALFFDFEAIKKILLFFWGNVFYFGALIVSFCLAFLFITRVGRK